MDDDFDLFDDLLFQAADKADKYLDAKKPKSEHIECLQSKFGHNEFRPKQWDIIRTIIEEKRDNCVIMPTGYGKSLCFQFPAVFTNGITLVVSPLISLMQDQVRSLHVANIPATFLGSAQTDRTIVNRVLAGEFRVVYVSPEYVGSPYGKEFLTSLEKKLTLIAIDEAHAISQWGHDFRVDYRKLGDIRKTVASVPILAVTATATPHVREDIVSMLRLKNPQVLCMGFDRPNIHFSFKPKGKDIWSDLKPFTTQIRGSVIIYVLKKATSEEIAKILRQHGVTCEIYHAGLSTKKRKDVLEEFTMDRIQVIVATVAFGMGIDKPDVRIVVHYGCSKNIETYVQEIGRAGRDGLASRAIGFFDDNDFQLHEWFLNQNHEHKSESVIQHLRQIGAKMKEFCYTIACRRKLLLDYFGSDTTNIKPRKNCCDNCDRGSSSVALSSTYEGLDDNGFYDFTTNGYLLLRAMQITSKSAIAISVLRGSGEKKAMEFKHEKEIFGAGKIWPKDYWSALMQQLKVNEYLTTKQLPLPYRPVTVIGSKGYDWLRSANRPRLILKAIPEIYQFFVKKRKVAMNNNLVVPSTSSTQQPTSVSAGQMVKNNNPQIEEPVAEDISYRLEIDMNDQHLEEVLLGIRTVMAENSDCMPYLVASNIAIKQMVEKKPVSVKEFKLYMIDGFSLAKIEKFASLFIHGIIKFMNNDFCLSKILRRFPLRVKTSKLTPATNSKLQKFINEKKSLTIIQKELSLSEAQIVDEIIILIRTGCPIQRYHFFHLVGCDDEMFTFIKDHVTDEDLSNLDNLDEIKAKLTEISKINETMLVLILNYLKVRQLMKMMNVPYFDIDENKLLNGEALLDTKIPGFSNSQCDEKTDEVKEEGKVDLKAFDFKTNNHKDEIENETETSKPLQTSHKPNQIQTLTDVKKFEYKDVKQLPTKTESIVQKSISTKQKRPTVKAAPKIEYLNSSDSDNEPEAKRVVPQWITVKKSANRNSSQPSGITKKASF